MIEKIKELEQASAHLQPDEKTRQHWLQLINDYTNTFLNELPDRKTYVVTKEKGKGIMDLAISDDGRSFESLLEAISEHVDLPGANPASAGYIAYIPGGGLYPSALGDYLAAVTNKYAGVFFAAPGAVRMEHLLVRWMADLLNLPASTTGALTSGGSIANQIAICTARDAHGIRARDFHRAVIYTTTQAHHCIRKAIRIAGMREAVQRQIPMDNGFRMDPQQLALAIKKDKAEGLLPFLVVASAGTTDIGAVDPLDKIADICQQEQLWFHVDGAYGGCFALCPEFKDILKGIERADSVVIDPHKGFFLPYGTGAILVRDGQKIYDAHHTDAHYMQDTLTDLEEISPTDLSPELSRHFRGLRMWLPLQLFGLKAFRAALSEKIWLCRYFYNKIQQISGFEVGPSPQLSVMLFRYVPKLGNANNYNEQLTLAIKEDGRILLSSTSINGQFYIRLAVLNFRTHLTTIDLTLEILKEKVEVLNKQLQSSFS